MSKSETRDRVFVYEEGWVLLQWGQVLHDSRELRGLHKDTGSFHWKVLFEFPLPCPEMAGFELFHGNSPEEGPESRAAEDQSSKGLQESRREEVNLLFLDLKSQVY